MRWVCGQSTEGNDRFSRLSERTLQVQSRLQVGKLLKFMVVFKDKLLVICTSLTRSVSHCCPCLASMHFTYYMI